MHDGDTERWTVHLPRGSKGALETALEDAFVQANVSGGPCKARDFLVYIAGQERLKRRIPDRKVQDTK